MTRKTEHSLNKGPVGEGRNCLEAVLELRSDKWGKVSQKVGLKVIQLLGGKREDVIGIGAEENFIEYLLKPDVDASRLKLGDINIQIEEGIRLTGVRQLGTKKTRLTLRGVPLSVSDMEIKALGDCLGDVSEKGVRYVIGDEGFISNERFMDLELKRNLMVPSKLMLRQKVVRLHHSGQKPACSNCFQLKENCKSGGFELKCKIERGRGDIHEMSMRFFMDIGFEGEPELMGDDVGKEEEISRKEIEKAAVGRQETPMKLKESNIRNSHIDGLVIKDLGKNETADSIKKGLEKLTVNVEDEVKGVEIKMGAITIEERGKKKKAIIQVEGGISWEIIDKLKEEGLKVVPWVDGERLLQRRVKPPLLSTSATLLINEDVNEDPSDAEDIIPEDNEVTEERGQNWSAGGNATIMAFV